MLAVKVTGYPTFDDEALQRLLNSLAVNTQGFLGPGSFTVRSTQQLEERHISFADPGELDNHLAVIGQGRKQIGNRDKGAAPGPGPRC